MPVLKIKQNGEWVDIAGGGASGGDPNAVTIDLENVNSGVASPVNADTLGGYLPAHYAPATKLTPRNLLDNSDFTNPVNQRGQTSYTGSGYSIDRWRAYHSDTTHTITDNGIQLTSTGVNPNLYQVLDQSIIDTTKKYTAVYCDLNGVIHIWTGYPNDTTAPTPICVYMSGSNMLFRIVIGAASGFDNTVVWAALYEGEYTAETLPEYQPKGYANELLACNVADTGNVSGMKLLWENASPASAFAGQKISIDLSVYDFIEIHCAVAANTNYVTDSFRVKVGKKAHMGTAYSFATASARQVTVTESGAEFAAGKLNDMVADKQTDDNSYMIPVYIYGIKGVIV